MIVYFIFTAGRGRGRGGADGEIVTSGSEAEGGEGAAKSGEGGDRKKSSHKRR